MKTRNTLMWSFSLSSLIVAVCGGYADSGGSWKKLFNEENLDDFVVVQGTGTYEVTDGVITGQTAIGSPNTFLVTRKVYADFELKFEVKVDDALNTGVQIRSFIKGNEIGDLENNGSFHGPQVEIEASPGQAGYVWGEYLDTGWLSQKPRSEDPEVNQHSVFKNGEWNQYHIIAHGADLTIYINDTLIDDFTLPAEVHQQFTKGHIGLQVHSISERMNHLHPLKVSWRNLLIKETESIPAIMGDWKGQWIDAPEKTYAANNPELVAQVIGRGDDVYKIQILEALDRRAEPFLTIEAKADQGVITFEENGWQGRITADSFQGSRIEKADGPSIRFELKKWQRTSPTLGLPPPEGAVVLFDGSSLSEWTHRDKDEATWKLVDGVIETLPRRENSEAGGDLRSRKSFLDCILHMEFRLPYEPEKRGQGRTNSGVFLQGAYEAQILDSYGSTGYWNEAGALYKVAPPMVNASAPPGVWQTYDIEFRAAKFDSHGNLVSYPHMTVRLNGVLIHRQQILEERTSHSQFGRAEAPLSQPGPIILQDHGHAIQFRNIWIQEL